MRRTRKNPIDIAREEAIPQTPDVLVPAQPIIARALVIRVLDQRRVRDRAVSALALGVIRRL